MQSTGTSIKHVFSVEAMVCVYYEYQNAWDAPVGEILRQVDNIHDTFAVAIIGMAKDWTAVDVPISAALFPISNFWAVDRFAYGPLPYMSPDRGIQFSSLPMHVLAEEILDDGIYKLCSPLGLGRGCLQVVFNCKYFSNTSAPSHVCFWSFEYMRKFWTTKFWQINCNLPNSPKFSPSKILCCTVCWWSHWS